MDIQMDTILQLIIAIIGLFCAVVMLVVLIIIGVIKKIKVLTATKVYWIWNS